MHHEPEITVHGMRPVLHPYRTLRALKPDPSFRRG